VKSFPPTLALALALALTVTIPTGTRGEEEADRRTQATNVPKIIAKVLKAATNEEEGGENSLDLKAEVESWESPDISALIIQTLPDWPDSEYRSGLGSLAQKAADNATAKDIQELARIARDPEEAEIPKLWACSIIERCRPQDPKGEVWVTLETLGGIDQILVDSLNEGPSPSEAAAKALAACERNLEVRPEDGKKDK
jgi:hypothetical protein